MKLIYKVSELANKFFFISNLAEWHFSCRKDYNGAWLKKTGPLSVKEKEALSDVRDLLIKIGFNYQSNNSLFVGTHFYCSKNENEAFLKVKEKNGKKAAMVLEIAFDIFDNRFKKIWNKKNLYSRIKKIASNKKAIKILSEFFGETNNNREIKIIVLDSPLVGKYVTAAGGANIDNKTITLELPSLRKKSWEAEYSYGIILHEIGHILLREGKWDKKIGIISKKNKIPRIKTGGNLSFFTEMIVELFAPYGIVMKNAFKNEKIFKICFSQKNLNVLEQNYYKYSLSQEFSISMLRKLLVYINYPIVDFYIQQNKRISNKFLLEIIKNSIKFIKKSTT